MVEVGIGLILAGLAALAIAYHFLTSKPANSLPLPPSPPKSKIPFLGGFIGNTVEMADTRTIFPTKLTKWAEEYGEIYSLTSLGQVTIVLNTHTAGKEVSGDPWSEKEVWLSEITPFKAAGCPRRQLLLPSSDADAPRLFVST